MEPIIEPGKEGWKDKALRTFRYLLEFAKLRETVVRNALIHDDYSHVWFQDIPFTLQGDPWIKTTRPIRPIKPECSDPSCHDNMIKCQEIQNSYHKLEEQYKKELNNYQELFGFYNKLKQSPEEFELLLGFGLCQFYWQNVLIQKHLILGKADIQFNPEDATISVSASLEGLELHIESDMMADLQGLQVSESDKVVNEKLDGIEELEHPLEDQIKTCLNAYANQLHQEGSFVDELSPKKEINSVPTIYFAPAVIFRKRLTKRYIQLYETIIKDLETDQMGTVASLFNELVDTPIETMTNGTREGEKETFFDTEILYFPKKYNDEQIKIIQKLERNNKILVLGPPGTGKSHTIANLICHLLATGNKILVTAQTKRALEVLKELIPTDISLLTINLLGNDKTSFASLERSINTITEKLNSAETDEMAQSIDRSIDKIKELKTSKSELENDWIEQQKLDDTSFKISSTYQGTFKEIASKIYDNTETYEWFTDSLPAKCTKKMLTIFTDLFTLSQIWKDKDVAHIEDPLPDCNSLVTPAQLDVLKLPTLPDNSLISRETAWETILTKNVSELNSLASSVLVYKEHLGKLLAFPTPLTKEVLNDELVNDKSKWISIYEVTRAHIKADVIQQCYYLDHSSHFEYPSPISLQQLYHDAKILHDFFKKGGTFANPIKNLLIPKEIKERRHFCSDVKVNGSDCDTLEEFEKVVLDLQHRINLSQLNEIWKSTIWESTDSLCTGYKKFMDLLDTLTSMIQEISEMKNCLKILKSNFSIPQDKILDLNYFATLADYLGVVQQKAQKEDIEDRLEKSLQALQNPDLHPLSLELKQTLEKRDSVKYQDLLDKAGKLEKERQDFVEYKMLLTRCREIFPQLSDDIVNQKITEKQIKQLNKAVDWMQAKNYMEKLLTPLDNNEIKSKIKDTESSIEQMIEKLVVDKSWLHLLHHLSVEDDLRKHLTSWMQYVKKIGKSESSKRGVKFRKLAQDEMTFCRGAIPCWIMPLYKVVETIKPTMGLFDFVIIDEASQLGPEAIFLLYMTKNIIIVGDDKQTSPEYIGVTSDSMKPYKDKYLYDIPFREHFGTDFSLFDFGRILCNDTIVLREHFRCMPEIIEFCNQQWYKPNGYSLFPLRQYNENRLEPIRSVFVENAFIEGTGTFIRNTNEADRIVEVLIACLNDDKYEGKTFGVIALQGSAQAKYMEKKILESVDPREIEKRKLICGNSSDFQGDERDIIFLSLVTTRDHNRAPLTKAEDERRFNVAISRAKDQLWLFHSVQLEDLHNTDDLRYKLLHYMLSGRDINQQISQEYPIPGFDPNRNIIGDKKFPKPFESLFEYEVFKAIRKQGYQVIPQYAVGKYRIDLVVVLRNGIKIAVECDGDSFHTDEQYYRDIVRQRELERCGWQFYRILASYFYVNPTKSLTPFWSLLSRNQDNITGDVLSGVSPENDSN